MQIVFTKTITVIFVLIFWTLFSAAYIMNDLWRDFKLTQLTVAYNQGRAETIQHLIQEASKCQPFNIYHEEQKVDLIAVQCLEQDGAKAAMPANTTEE